jgi:hypothetical protein
MSNSCQGSPLASCPHCESFQLDEEFLVHKRFLLSSHPEQFPSFMKQRHTQPKNGRLIKEIIPLLHETIKKQSFYNSFDLHLLFSSYSEEFILHVLASCQDEQFFQDSVILNYQSDFGQRDLTGSVRKSLYHYLVAHNLSSFIPTVKQCKVLNSHLISTCLQASQVDKQFPLAQFLALRCLWDRRGFTRAKKKQKQNEEVKELEVLSLSDSQPFFHSVPSPSDSDLSHCSPVPLVIDDQVPACSLLSSFDNPFSINSPHFSDSYFTFARLLVYSEVGSFDTLYGIQN